MAKSRALFPSVLVVGAGPAGLATAAELARRRMPYRLLERGGALGHSWENLYDSLRLHTGRHMSALPGRGFPRGTPLFPSRAELLQYLRSYAIERGVVVETGREVTSLERTGNLWHAATGDGESIEAGAVVMCTGIIANPKTPAIEGRERFRGRVMHSIEYRRPDEFVGQRVLVVGVGNSGAEIASELAHTAAAVTVAVRSGANVVPLAIAGVPIQYLSYALRKLPRGGQEWVVRRVQRLTDRKRGAPVLPRPSHSALDAIPLIGFHLVDAIRDGLVAVKRAGLRRFVEAGVAFDDGSQEEFDTVILATGFAPALASLGALVRVDSRGFAIRSDRVRSADQPGLFFVGHNYDATGGLRNIRRDAVEVAAAIARGEVRDGTTN